MEQPQPKAPPLATSAVTVSPEELSSMKFAIPLLKLMDEKDSNFTKLVQLIKEMAILNYDPSKKYELMYKVIKIGTYMELLLNKGITAANTGELFQTCNVNKKINELNEQQQYAFFKIARNIVADAFHQLYDDKTKIFLENFSNLCRGNNVYGLFAEFRKYNHLITKNAKKFFTEPSLGNIRKEKTFCQLAYFLLKAEALFFQGNTDGAIMALIAAGSCGRDFNVSGLNVNKADAECFKLSELRKRLSHSEANRYNENGLLIVLKETLNKESFLKHFTEIKNEAFINLNKEIDVETYYNTKEKSGAAPESPRAYDRHIYKHS